MLVNTDAERSVIGSLLQATDCHYLLSELTPDDFTSDGYKRAFVAMCALRAKKIAIDTATVNVEMGGDALGMLIDAYRMTPTAVNVGSYARMVSEATAARTLHNNLRKQADRLAGGMAETDEVADAVRGCLRDGRSSGCLVSIADAAMEAFEEIEQVVTGKRKNIMTGIPLFDSLTNGFRKGEVTLLAAKTGVGKSALAAQIGMYAAKCGNEVALCPLEMSKAQYLKRMYANITGIPCNAMDKEGGIADSQWELLGDAANEISQLPIKILDRTRTVEGLRAVMEAHTPKLLIIDYIQLLETRKKSENEVVRLGNVSLAVKSMALELNIPILALAQLKRVDSRSENQQRAAIMPILSDLRGSGNLEQDADNVIFLHRPDAEGDRSIDDRDKGLFKMLSQTTNKSLIILANAKQRMGELGRFPMVFQKDVMRFTQIDRRTT